MSLFVEPCVGTIHPVFSGFRIYAWMDAARRGCVAGRTRTSPPRKDDEVWSRSDRRGLVSPNLHELVPSDQGAEPAGAGRRAMKCATFLGLTTDSCGGGLSAISTALLARRTLTGVHRASLVAPIPNTTAEEKPVEARPY